MKYKFVIITAKARNASNRILKDKENTLSLENYSKNALKDTQEKNNIDSNEIVSHRKKMTSLLLQGFSEMPLKNQPTARELEPWVQVLLWFIYFYALNNHQSID